MRKSLHIVDAIRSETADRPLRLMHVCSDHERVIVLSDMRRLLNGSVDLLAGPGSASCICPEADIYQAICLARRHPLTLLTSDKLLRVPLSHSPGAASLAEARDTDADVRVTGTPFEALALAEADPSREFVLFAAGFETLLSPLAGMFLQGVPENISLLLCGRRIDPVVIRLIEDADPPIDGLLVPGNRCALTGFETWTRFARQQRCPVAVAGYTSTGILAAVLAIARQHARAEAHVENCYRAMARSEGDAIARDRFDRLFESAEGDWRGFGRLPDSAFVLRRAYDTINANQRFPDYRGEFAAGVHGGMPPRCDCLAVMSGRKSPPECALYSRECTPDTPRGPCMAAADGTCALH